MSWIRRFGPPDPRRFLGGTSKRWLLVRFAIYACVVGALVVYRVIPGFRGAPPQQTLFAPADTSLVIAGADLAPGLVDRLAAEYRLEYPKVHTEIRGGGTAHGLEDLLNGHADVAFLSRLPTTAEAEIIRAEHDSITAFPVSLGGVAVLASSRSGRDAMSLDDLARTLGRGAPVEGDAERVYVPEPNLGLWGAVAEKLGLPSIPPVLVHWVASDQDVVGAVAGDLRSIGLASTLALPEGFEEAGVQYVALRSSGAPFSPLHDALITGDYPLFHHLYVSCRAGSSAQAAAFVTYVFSGRGQRMVSRAGYVPAREVPHLVQLVSKPIGASGT